jgi:hypothetical protein
MIEMEYDLILHSGGLSRAEHSQGVMTGASMESFIPSLQRRTLSWNSLPTLLKLKMIEMEYDLILHIVHVSGRRMIQQGSGGLSRAEHSQGVMTGASMESFIPLHKTAIEREERLGRWLDNITRGLDFQLLEPEGSFSTAHSREFHLELPPLATADVVMEQLAHARHKRPEGLHIVVVPQLMTGRWRWLMIRRTDVYARLLSYGVWPLGQHCEPLLIFIALPFRSWEPEHQHRAGFLERFQRVMLVEGLSASFGP